MATRDTKPQTGDFSFALGGLAGNNAQGAGFLAAALDAKMTPTVLSCTSGQIYWTYLYLTALKKGRNGDFLEENMDEYLAETEPFPSRDANLWRMAFVGKPHMMRLAVREWTADVMRNAVVAASKAATEWPTGFAWKTLADIWPERVAICEFEDSFFEDVADAFNEAGEDDIAIAFNAYHPRKGREVVHMNGRAFEMHKKHPGETGPGNNSASYRSRTTYEEITPESVRDGLWIYQYGVAGREGFDGCYFRQTMLSEAALTPTIFVCRPINYKWLGELPTSYIEGEDLKTEVFMNAAYQGERDKIELMNKLLEQKALDQSRYHPVRLEEVELEVQRGYFDYVFEDKAVFDQARAEAHKRFRAFIGAGRSWPMETALAPAREYPAPAAVKERLSA